MILIVCEQQRPGIAAKLHRAGAGAEPDLRHLRQVPAPPRGCRLTPGAPQQSRLPKRESLPSVLHVKPRRLNRRVVKPRPFPREERPRPRRRG